MAMHMEKMPERKVWIVNKGEQIDQINLQLKKHIFLKTDIPQQFPLNIALKYVGKFKNVEMCGNPQDYFKHRKLKKLILRDAGIGDLLMLEPILRKMATDQNMEVDVACMYPEVFEGHPTIHRVLTITGKEHIQDIKFADYDCWEDLRNYSETSPMRDKQHRTDIYNIPFNVEIDHDEKEPRLYFQKGEKSILKKKKGKVYIGVQCDASHKYRRYDRGRELIEYILNQDSRNVAVLLGSYEFVHGVNSNRAINLQGKTSRREAIRIVRDLDYLVAADSGLLHVAMTCHTPVVAMFSIITPEFRVRYYRGERRIIWKDMECRGCGDWHMVQCKKHGRNADESLLAPCMDIEPAEIYRNMMEMPINSKKRVFDAGEAQIVQHVQEPTKAPEKPVAVPVRGPTNGRTLTMPIIVQNEEKNLPRFIELVMSHPAIGRTVAIDGGSTDKTVELLRKAGAEVYVHPYLKEYHEMQAMQRNISCSYLKQGEHALIMDIDECFSPELSEYLETLAHVAFPFGLISRRTFDYYADIGNPKKQIGQYPDYQPRFYIWDWKFKFVRGAHHVTLNTPEPVQIAKDIIHFHSEGKNRPALERQWAGMQSKGLQYA